MTIFDCTDSSELLSFSNVDVGEQPQTLLSHAVDDAVNDDANITRVVLERYDVTCESTESGRLFMFVLYVLQFYFKHLS